MVRGYVTWLAKAVCSDELNEGRFPGCAEENADALYTVLKPMARQISTSLTSAKRNINISLFIRCESDLHYSYPILQIRRKVTHLGNGWRTQVEAQHSNTLVVPTFIRLHFLPVLT